MRGRSVNHALALAFAFLLRNTHSTPVAFAVNDNGFSLILPPFSEVPAPSSLFHEAHKLGIKHILLQALPETEYFLNRFRHAATRSLLLLKQWNGKRISPDEQLRRARYLYQEVKHTPSFPPYQEALREILQDELLIQEAQQLVNKVVTNQVVLAFSKHPDTPSIFTHSLILAGSIDVLLLEDKKQLLLSLHDQILRTTLGNHLPSNTQFVLPFVYKKRREQHVLQYLTKEQGEIITPWIPLSKAGQELEELTEHLQLPLSEYLTKLENKNELQYTLFIDKGEWLNNRFLLLQNYSWNHSLSELKKEGLFHFLELLVYNKLYFWGPSTFQQIQKRLKIQHEHLLEILKELQSRTIIQHGTILGKEQYFLKHDYHYFTPTPQPLSTAIHPRFKTISSIKSYSQFLQEKGPLRTIIDFAQRIREFKINDFVNELKQNKVVFNALIAGRYTYYSINDLPLFQSVYSTHELSTEETIILELLSSIQPATVSQLKQVLKEPHHKIKPILTSLSKKGFVNQLRLYPLSHHSPSIYYSVLPQQKLLPRDQAIVQLVYKAIQWYQPLTIYSLKRLLRLEYHELDLALQELLIQGRINTTLDAEDNLYFHLQTTPEKDFDEKNPPPFLLHNFDPILSYEIRLHLPKYNELIILKDYKELGRITYAIRQKQELQLLNISLPRHEFLNFTLISTIISNILHLANKVFKTPIIRIEQLNSQSPFLPEFSTFGKILEEYGFTKKNDSYLQIQGATSTFQQAFSSFLYWIQNTSLETIVKHFPWIHEFDLVSMANIPKHDLRAHVKKSKTLFYLQDTLIHRHWFGINQQPLTQSQIQLLDFIKSSKGARFSDLITQTLISKDELFKQLFLLHVKGKVFIHGPTPRLQDQIIFPIHLIPHPIPIHKFQLSNYFIMGTFQLLESYHDILGIDRFSFLNQITEAITKQHMRIVLTPTQIFYTTLKGEAEKPLHNGLIITAQNPVLKAQAILPYLFITTTNDKIFLDLKIVKNQLIVTDITNLTSVTTYSWFLEHLEKIARLLDCEKVVIERLEGLRIKDIIK